ncbi:MAG: peptidoglycan editing factor PgeF [Candidatus Omnitrophica bacterium]|nr:peptidoglycan editing factor PgeF [Candidatus Omnitrophota bacterium]
MNLDGFDNFFPNQVKAIFTDATTDFVLPPQALGLSAEQKKFLRHEYQIDADKIFTIRQVHGNKILTISAGDIPQQEGLIPQADGVVTNVPGVVLSVRTADCLPVFLYDPQKESIGLVHAGWQSSAQKIVKQAIAALKQNYGSCAVDLRVAFGPAIGVCCYEVGAEFATTFPGEVLVMGNKRYLDLPLVNKNQLLSLGVQPANIFDNASCTVCGKGFFSYRRDKEQSGRHLSMMMMETGIRGGKLDARRWG